MKKTLFATILAALIGLFSTQASACGGDGAQCKSCKNHDMSKMQGESCGCKSGSCKGK
jgi:hypothetical protein